ncbi:bifunctional methylenetetrahydrofolate dehydrogenase/cyclohydrolase, mitochondrial-like [Polyodon spathula]|uniref:bifunctional methylenetetrahydrofolate dehydrogenase/cyclohydrolase, mitochondrial-like n=1 Tax=Polyodon spathula TaxID=7913 RepID=UPI001B7F13B2|nr:bifunctional methylenetetrahydrofolate dehydrogenase/cyclohydrolase, mitochondrial-like [Polyodon spathula]
MCSDWDGSERNLKGAVWRRALPDFEEYRQYESPSVISLGEEVLRSSLSCRTGEGAGAAQKGHLAGGGGREAESSSLAKVGGRGVATRGADPRATWPPLKCRRVEAEKSSKQGATKQWVSEGNRRPPRPTSSSTGYVRTGGTARRPRAGSRGSKLARQIRQEAKSDVEQWVSEGNRRPHLSVVLVGDNPGSHSYVLNKTKAAADVGISSETILKPADISEKQLLELIDKLNNDSNVDGLLVQLPLPEHIDERKVCNAVVPGKDVDGFHVVNVGKMCLDQRTMLPATPSGVWEIIKRTGIPTLGKNVVVAGRSKNVGMPIAMLLHTDGRHERPGGDATVTISHRYTPKDQLRQHTQIADIVVAAAGIPNLITADMIKEGAAVIDVGINRVQDPVTGKPKLVGDVDFEGVKRKASFITPVPGGVGPMTVAMLMKNTIIAAKKLLTKPAALGITAP